MYLRLLKKKVLGVVLATEHDVQYYTLDRTRWYSRSCLKRGAWLRATSTPQAIPVHALYWSRLLARAVLCRHSGIEMSRGTHGRVMSLVISLKPQEAGRGRPAQVRGPAPHS